MKVDPTRMCSVPNISENEIIFEPLLCFSTVYIYILFIIVEKINYLKIFSLFDYVVQDPVYFFFKV